MYKIDLFEKKEAMNVNEYNELLQLLTSHGFKVSSALEKNVNECARITRNGGKLTRKHDYIVAWVGDTQHNNLISVWSSHETRNKVARYTVRISTDLQHRLETMHNGFKYLFSNMTYTDSNENSVMLFNIADIYRFFETVFNYQSVAQQTKETQHSTEKSMSA